MTFNENLSEKEAMLEQNANVSFLKCFEQAELALSSRYAESCSILPNKQKHQHAEITSDHPIDMLADSYNQSREAYLCQNENRILCGISRPQISRDTLSKLQIATHFQKNTSTIVKKPMRKLMLSDFEPSKDKKGMRRRRFQFGKDMNNPKSLLPYLVGSMLQQVPVQSKEPVKSTFDSYQSTRVDFSSDAGMTPTVNMTKRTGYGLHLNSIVRTLPKAPMLSNKEMHNASIKPSKFANIKQLHIVQKEPKIFKDVNPRQSTKRIHEANMNLVNTDIKTESRLGKRILRSEQHDLFDELNESAPKKKRTPTRTDQGDERTPDSNSKFSMKASIVTRTDFSNLQYHAFVTPSLDPPSNKEFSPSGHISIGIRSFLDSNSNSSEKLKNLQPSSDADKYSHSRSNSPLQFAKDIDYSPLPGTSVLLSQDNRLPLVGPPVMHGKSRQKKVHSENDYGCKLGDAKEETEKSDHSTPVNSVIIRSPNSKRSCYRKALALHKLGSASSYTLTKARKFVLISVPASQASQK